MKISSKEFQEIVKEECIRIKKKMMLESEKKQILKEMQECDMMDETTPDLAAKYDSSIGSKDDIKGRSMHNLSIILSRISPKQMEKIADDMQSAGLHGSNEDFKTYLIQTLPMNEITSEIWDKSKLYNWFIGAGLGAIVSGIAATALGSAIESSPSKEINTNFLVVIASDILTAIHSKTIGSANH